MSDYRRLYVPGGTYFFTVRLQDPTSDLLVRQIALLRDATRLTMKRFPFAIDAAVVLPAKLHMIWTMPADDADFSKRWRMIKSGFSRHVPSPVHIPRSHVQRGEKGIWQRRFWEHLIRDADDLLLHQHLIRSAPVHAGLVSRPGDWPHSSFARLRTTGPVPSAPDREAVVTASRTVATVDSEMS